MIKKLHNPKLEEYNEFKQHVLSNDFPWYYHSISTPDLNKKNYMNTPFYGHTFLMRPEDVDCKYSRSYSSSTDLVAKILLNILNYNQIEINSFLRINANCVEPGTEVVNSVPHHDHYYPHTNIVVYLTNAGGDTIVEDEVYSPSEDDVIIFQGEHYMQTPKKERRIILIATFI